MNARKKKKRIKKQIEKLRNEYNKYRRVNIQHSCITFQEFKVDWQIPDIYYDLAGKPDDNLINYAHERLARTLLENIKNAGLIDYSYRKDYPYPCIRAKILVGRGEM